jgi:hypothetical protein
MSAPPRAISLCKIALANPHLSGIGFDLAEVGPIFEDYVEEHNLGGRLRFQAGSFFEHPLPQADVITMGHILHDWNLDEKIMLLRKAQRARFPAPPYKRGTLQNHKRRGAPVLREFLRSLRSPPSGGAVVAYDAIIDDDRSQNAFGLMMSLNMLIETPGGFDYTAADCMSAKGASSRAAIKERNSAE